MFEGGEGIDAIEGLWLLLLMGAEGTRGSNLWLHAGGLGGGAVFVGDDTVNLQHDRVVCDCVSVSHECDISSLNSPLTRLGAQSSLL